MQPLPNRGCGVFRIELADFASSAPYCDCITEFLTIVPDCIGWRDYDREDFRLEWPMLEAFRRLFVHER